jgi:hypothetical protein
MSTTLTGIHNDWFYKIQLDTDSDSIVKVVELVLTPSDNVHLDDSLTARYLRNFPLTRIVEQGFDPEPNDVDELFRVLTELKYQNKFLGKYYNVLVTSLAYTIAIQRGSYSPSEDTSKLLSLSVGAVQARLQRARDLGFMPHSPRRGVRGGVITAEGKLNAELLVESILANGGELA